MVISLIICWFDVFLRVINRKHGTKERAEN